MQPSTTNSASTLRLVKLAGAALLGTMAPGVYAQEVAPAPQQPEQEQAEDQVIEVTAERDEDRVEVCRSVPITGTRFRERICSTPQEQREATANTRDMVNDLRYEGAPIIEDVEGMEGVPAVPPV